MGSMQQPIQGQTTPVSIALSIAILGCVLALARVWKRETTAAAAQ